jgi:adhesin transport system outer membrane protein
VAQAELDAAKWQRYPTPSVEVSRANSASQIPAYPDRLQIFRLDQPLWTGGRITAGIDAADRRLDAAGAGVLETRQEVALRVVNAAGEALRQKARLRFAEAGVVQHENLLAMIRRRVEQEVSPVADLRLAESRLYLARNDLSLAQESLANALAQLGQLTGRPVSAFGGADFVAAAQPAGLPDTLDKAVDMAIARAPSLRRLGFELEAAQADIASRRSAYQPQLLLRLESLHGAVTENRALLVLQAQPGAGLSAFSAVDAAVARRDTLQHDRQAAERQVREQVETAWHDWQGARVRAENAERSRASAAEVAQSYARQYVAGRKSWLDVLNAVRENVQAELALADVSAQVQIAALRLKVLTGVLDLAQE